MAATAHCPYAIFSRELIQILIVLNGKTVTINDFHSSVHIFKLGFHS